LKTRLLHIALLIFCLLLPTSSRAADFGAAFLESGIGGRALGMGSAFAAVADDASASYWNPAGLIRAHGKVFLASHQPLSLDRQHDSISFALNLRRELGFGITWLHAGVNNIEGRTTDGRPTGDIEDAANAYYVSVGRALGRRLAIGVTMKVVNQDIKVPRFDLGFQFHLSPKTVLAGIVRSLNAELSWKVERGADQSSNTEDKLPTILVLGASHRPLDNLLLAADFYSSDVDSYANLGAEWKIGPVLTLRGGLNRVPGTDRGIGSTTAGLTLRPMRQDTLRFHYTYASDELGDGGRTAVGLALQF
jgi:long-subunit fatty acid transport protein